MTEKSSIKYVDGKKYRFRYQREVQGDAVYFRVEKLDHDMAGEEYWAPFWFMTESHFRQDNEPGALRFDFISAVLDEDGTP